MVNPSAAARPAARRPVVPTRGDGESVHIFGDIYARYCNGNPFPVLYTRTSDGTRNAHSDKDADAAHGYSITDANGSTTDTDIDA